MTIPVSAPAHYADFQGLDSLKVAARDRDPAALREAARQFESLFTHMLLKSMREASGGESMGDSDDVRFYQDMFDQQMAVQLSKGEGIGLAARLIEQLSRESARPAARSEQASAAAETAGASVSDTARAEFVQRLWPHAQRAGDALGVAPESIVAQAALESGWGKHLPADERGNSFNFFGIKAGNSWRGASTRSGTVEYAGGVATRLEQPFRSHGSLEASVQDYVQLIGSRPAFAQALKDGGYATDPDYVNKLMATAESVQRQVERLQLKGRESGPIPALAKS
jgi:flagellar protein FlgJ